MCKDFTSAGLWIKTEEGTVFHEGSHLTVFSAVIPRQWNSSLQQKGKTVVTNTVREAVLHVL